MNAGEYKNNNLGVYLIGKGGNSKIIIDICKLCGYRICGIFDDNICDTVDGYYSVYPIVGTISNIINFKNINLIMTIGDLKIRSLVLDKINFMDIDHKLGLNWINCIHPQSYISPSVKMGYGNVICYGAVINSDAEIKNFNLINTCAIIEHDCKIGSNNHFAPKSTLCGTVIVNNNNLFGSGTTVKPNINIIGSGNIFGSMACVTKDIVTDNRTYIGIPAKIINLV